MDIGYFTEQCKHLFALNCIDFSNYPSDFFDRLYIATEFILEKNKETNLTAIRSEEEFIPRHWTDALTCEKYIQKSSSVLDIGTGGGILAIAYALARPDISVTSVDSTSKKIDIVTECAIKCGIKNLKAISARAEELSFYKKHREAYDFVCARAVASLPVLCELCIPFVKINGVFFALKGRNAQEELALSNNAIVLLGGKLETKEHIILKENAEDISSASDRYLFGIKKISTTPELYPRKYAKISKSPL